MTSKGPYIVAGLLAASMVIWTLTSVAVGVRHGIEWIIVAFLPGFVVIWLLGELFARWMGSRPVGRQAIRNGQVAEGLAMATLRR